MHELEQKARAAGEALIKARAAFKAAATDAGAAGFKVTIQSNADGEFVAVSGGPVRDDAKPDAAKTATPAPVIAKPTEGGAKA